MSTTPSTPSLRQQLAATVRRCAVLTALVVGLAVGCTHGGVTTQQATEAPSRVATATQEPNEDEPGFDCRIHGNRVCGVIGTYSVPTGELTVYSDASARFDPSRVCNRDAGPCREGELTGVDHDGELMFAHDLNGDGVISGDVEYGS